MNIAFRIIINRTTGLKQVVSELAKSPSTTSLKKIITAGLFSAAMFSSVAHANTYTVSGATGTLTAAQLSTYTAIDFGGVLATNAAPIALTISGAVTNFNLDLQNAPRRNLAQTALYTPNTHIRLILGGNTTFTPASNSSFAGTIVLNNGVTLTNGGLNSIPNGADIYFNTNTNLNLNNYDLTLNYLHSSTNATNANINIGNNTLTINGTNRTSFNTIYTGGLTSNAAGNIIFNSGNNIFYGTQNQHLGTTILKNDALYRAIMNDSNQSLTGNYNLENNTATLQALLQNTSTSLHYTIDANITGNGALTLLSNASTATATLNRALGNTGTLSIENTILHTTAANQLNENAPLQFALNGSLILNNHDQTIAGLNSANNANVGNNHIDLGSATLTVKGTTGDTRYVYDIIGTGNFIKQGSNTLTFAGSLDHTGTTTISDGTLILGYTMPNPTPAQAWLDGTTGHIAGNIINNANFVFNRSNAYDYNGEISGSGNVYIRNNGDITLSNTNTYTGTTTIESGTLQIGNGGTTGSIISDITNNSNLIFNRSDDHTYSGTISGSGDISKIGAGLLTITANNTHTGTTTISDGSLQLGNGGTTGSLAGAIINNGSLIINRSDDLSFSNTLSGTGTLVKLGDNTLTLDGTNTNASHTMLNQGRLIVGSSAGSNAILNSSLDAANGSSLGGHGQIVGNLTMNNGSTLSPGNSIGTMTVQGNVNLQAGSTMLTEIDPSGSSDRLVVNGNIDLGGANLHVEANGTTWNPSTEYKIIEANAVTGSFSNITTNLIFLEPQKFENPQDVTLKLVRNNVSLGSVAENPNQQAVAQALDSNPSSALAFSIVTLDRAQAITAFDQLSGEIHANTRSVLFDESRHLREAVNNRLYAGQSGFASGGLLHSEHAHGLGLWFKGYGAEAKFDGSRTHSETKNRTAGSMMGLDLPIGEHWRAGLTAAYAESDIKVDKHRAKADVDSTSVGLYLGGTFKQANLRAGAVYSWNSVDSRRHVDYGSTHESLTASYNANTTQVFAEVGYPMSLADAHLEPFAGLTYVKVAEDKVRERGGLAALSSHSGNNSLNYGSLGVRGAASLAEIKGMPLDLQASLAWQHAFDRPTTKSTLSFANHDPFTISGVPLSKNSALVQTGLDLKVTPHASIGLNYSGLLGTDSKDHAVRLGLNIAF